MHTRSARGKGCRNERCICTTRRRTSSTCPDYTQTITLGVPSRPRWTLLLYRLIRVHSSPATLVVAYERRFPTPAHHIAFSLLHALPCHRGWPVITTLKLNTVSQPQEKRETTTDFAHVHVHHRVHAGEIVEVNHECELHSTGIYCSKCQAAWAGHKGRNEFRARPPINNSSTTTRVSSRENVALFNN